MCVRVISSQMNDYLILKQQILTLDLEPENGECKCTSAKFSTLRSTKPASQLAVHVSAG